MNELKAFAEAIWTMDGDKVRMYGIPFQTRMTVIRLSSGGLWIHSPIAPDAERIETIRQLGNVEHLVAPNKIHSLGISAWKKHVPAAEVWLSPEFNARHPDVTGDAMLSSVAPTEWLADIDQLQFEGSAFLDEIVFLHRSSRTLIVTDLIQKHDPATESWFWWLIKKLAGVAGAGGGTARDLRATFRDRAAAQRSRDRLLQWDFDNLIICHGLCIRGGAKRAVAEAFSWLGPQAIKKGSEPGL